MSDISDSENEVDVVETLNVGCVTNKEFLKLTTSRVIKKTRKIWGMKILSRQVR
jgi:hypothetical protein